MRQSAFKGNWVPNKRPYVVLTPDVFVSIQGETSVIGCGECRREININDYMTSVSTEAAVDSAPGSATINLSVPDTDINDFYIDGQLVIIPMMEIEVYAKGYFLIGGFPQYYRVFWGLVSSVSKSWSGGTTTLAISCKDILRWWELTNVTINPAFTESFGGSAGGYQLWQNQFAAMNPSTIIIKLAKESMGDFSITQGSFTSFTPEKGPEGPAIGAYAKDVMAYWQLKFANIWNSLVIYGSSGELYSFTGDGDTVSPVNLSAQMNNQEEKLSGNNQATSVFKIQPNEITPFKQELSRAGDVELFQTEAMSKLSIAQACRDQSGWEFFCDPSGDIVFKPPFYNLNVLPNKPISWIQNYEIIDDSVTDSEAEVYTHITSSGNAFGGTMDWGLNDEITTPRTGVIDFHLLRRYGWRRLDYQCEWAGNPKKLFYWLMDYLDRMNAKRQAGSVTIPMRPELKLGFPIWFPKYDSFFYVTGISHQFSVGGQATTTLTLIAKRSKFIAPNNIGFIKKSGNTRDEMVRDYGVPWKNGEPKNKVVDGRRAWNSVQIPTYEIGFPNRLGDTAGLSNEETMGQPVVVRSPKTGKLLGFPNAVMVYRSTIEGTVLSKILEEQGSNKSKAPANQDKGKKDTGPKYNYDYTVTQTFSRLRGDARAKTISSLRAHRYEAGMTNGGAYDYARDEDRVFQEMTLIPTNSISWNKAGEDPNQPSTFDKTVAAGSDKKKAEQQKAAVDAQAAVVKTAKGKVDAQVTAVSNIDKQLTVLLKKLPSVPKTVKKAPPTPGTPDGTSTTTATEPPDIVDKRAELQVAKDKLALLQKDYDEESLALTQTKANQGTVRTLASLNVLVRPVSDDFGFEVIGHNKYGRGAFIDRGKIQLAGDAPGGVINRINVQFAPTGGLLTDPGIVGAQDGSSADFAASFERMQPDDYVTGATFTGSNKSSDIKEFQFTDQNTYTNQINANVGHSLYVEADQTRKSKTLGELKPTIAIGGLDGLDSCSCGIGRADWLALLPTDVIVQVLKAESGADVKPQNVENAFGAKITSGATPGSPTSLSLENDKANKAIAQIFPGLDVQTTFTGLDAIVGNVTTGGFFDALTKYLQKLVATNYEANARREGRSNAEERGVVSQLFDAEEQTNILGDDGQDPLFARAASGDPAALDALRNQVANSNFGMTAAAGKNFKKAWDDGKEKLQQTFEHFGASGGTTVFAVSAGNASGSVGVSVGTVGTQPSAEAAAATAAAANATAVSALTQATTGVPPSQSPQPKQVQPRRPSPNLRSLIVNPSSPAALNQPLVDAQSAAFTATISTTPGPVDPIPTSKPKVKKPGTP